MHLSKSKKNIHYFLEGKLNYNYMESWRKNAGSVEFVEWTSKNIPYVPSLEKHIENKKWALISDFVRRWAIFEYGGIYLDFDVELIKPIDIFFDYESFVCIEGYPLSANNAVSGGKKGNKFHKKMIEDYIAKTSGKKEMNSCIELECGPICATEFVESEKKSKIDHSDLVKIKEYNGFITLPKEYFYPFNWNEKFKEDCIKEKTHGIHWWKKGWS